MASFERISSAAARSALVLATPATTTLPALSNGTSMVACSRPRELTKFRTTKAEPSMPNGTTFKPAVSTRSRRGSPVAAMPDALPRIFTNSEPRIHFMAASPARPAHTATMDLLFPYSCDACDAASTAAAVAVLTMTTGGAWAARLAFTVALTSPLPMSSSLATTAADLGASTVMAGIFTVPTMSALRSNWVAQKPWMLTAMPASTSALLAFNDAKLARMDHSCRSGCVMTTPSPMRFALSLVASTVYPGFATGTTAAVSTGFADAMTSFAVSLASSTKTFLEIWASAVPNTRPRSAWNQDAVTLTVPWLVSFMVASTLILGLNPLTPETAAATASAITFSKRPATIRMPA